MCEFLFGRKPSMCVGIQQEGRWAEKELCKPAQLSRHLRLRLSHLHPPAVLHAHPLWALSGLHTLLHLISAKAFDFAHLDWHWYKVRTSGCCSKRGCNVHPSKWFTSSCWFLVAGVDPAPSHPHHPPHHPHHTDWQCVHGDNWQIKTNAMGHCWIGRGRGEDWPNSE